MSRLVFISSLLLSAFLISGCKNLQTPAAEESDAIFRSWQGSEFKPERSVRPTGIESRAKEIEQRLGIH